MRILVEEKSQMTTIKVIKTKKCRLCLGSKFVRFIPMYGIYKGRERPCPRCGGQGSINDEQP